MYLAECLARVRTVLAAEWDCTPEDLDRPGVLVTTRPDQHMAWPEQGRRYTPYEPGLALVSLGRGTVIAASAGLLAAVERIYAGLDRDGPFEIPILAAADALLRPHGLRLAGPLPRLVCGSDTLRDRPAPPGVSIAVEVLPPIERLLELGGSDSWPNAISRRAVAAGKREAAVAIARADGALAGVASVGMDAPILWQIGIDVAAAFQGRGIAPALVAALARYTLDQGAVPWYSHDPANILSARTASAAGFVPAWLEAFTYGPLSR